MQISHVKRMLRKNHTGNFRPLKPGEEIEAADIIVADTYYDFPAEQHIGAKCEPKDCILRLEFNEKGPRHA